MTLPLTTSVLPARVPDLCATTDASEIRIVVAVWFESITPSVEWEGERYIRARPARRFDPDAP